MPVIEFVPQVVEVEVETQEFDFDLPDPPRASIQFIYPDGTVIIYFDKDMKVPTDLGVFKSTSVKTGPAASVPAIELDVISGVLSDPEDLKFSWSVLDMKKQQLTL